MNRKWMPITAGVLGLFSGTSAIVYGGIITFSVLSYMYIVLYGIPLILYGVLTVAGGIFSAKRDKWPLVLAGATTGILIALIFFIYVRVTDNISAAGNPNPLSEWNWWLAVAPGLFILPLILTSKIEFKNEPSDWIKILSCM